MSQELTGDVDLLFGACGGTGEQAVGVGGGPHPAQVMPGRERGEDPGRFGGVAGKLAVQPSLEPDHDAVALAEHAVLDQ